MLEVRLLGSLEVADGERILTPHRRKPRSLLAVLALRAGRPVPKDVLVDLVWGEDAPRRAVDALENYISQLRKALGRDTIATEPAGYRLTLPPEQVDVARFERLVGSARCAGRGTCGAAGEALAPCAARRSPTSRTSRSRGRGRAARRAELSAREELSTPSWARPPH